MILAPGTSRRTPATISLRRLRCTSAGIRPAAARPPRYRRSAPHRRRPGIGAPDNRSRPHQNIDQTRKGLRMAIGEHPRRRLVGRAAARDHVGRHRPGRAAEAEERHVWPAARSSPAGWSRRSAPAWPDRPRAAQRVDPPRSSSGSSRGPSPATKRTFWPSACGITRISENKIAASKPNRRIGCKRHLGGELRREAQIEDAAGLFADRPYSGR